MRKTRLFVKQEKLTTGEKIEINQGDFDYMVKVLRKKVEDELFIFNGIDGEFRAIISEIGKRNLTLIIAEKIADLQKSPNITLAFAPVKNARVDFIAAKATELGISKFQPIITTRTIVNKINNDRFAANIKEACEQCERNDFAEISEIKKLNKFLEEKDSAEKLFILCDESGKGLQAKELFPKLLSSGKCTKEREIVIVIGPEGGFSPEEFEKMSNLRNLHSMSLGPRILRADTAMMSALTLVQEFAGDFG